MLRWDFPGPRDCDEIIYTPVGATTAFMDLEPDASVSGIDVWSSCSFGNATVMFDDMGRLELIEVLLSEQMRANESAAAVVVPRSLACEGDLLTILAVVGCISNRTVC